MPEGIDTIKKLVCRETLLTYPNFNKPFVIRTDANKSQLRWLLVKMINLSPSMIEN